MPESYTEPLGQSNAFLDFQEMLSRAAKVDRPILLIGERGTGKELAAAKLHYLSQRWRGPLVALNCAALAPTLLESELFGHEEGAFTGANQRRTGRFEAATDGTLFLDEIAQIPTEVQEKILRVVEYGSFERVGSSRSIQVDARIIGATNADLPSLARQGRFKRDLLDRLSFDVLFVPPLRARGEDILLLANHFAARMAHELGWEALPRFSPQRGGANGKLPLARQRPRAQERGGARRVSIRHAHRRRNRVRSLRPVLQHGHERRNRGSGAGPVPPGRRFRPVGRVPGRGG